MSSSVPHAVEEALSRGFQISPDAVKILQKLAEYRRGRKTLDQGPSLDIMIREVIEVKAKNSRFSISVSALHSLDLSMAMREEPWTSCE